MPTTQTNQAKAGALSVYGVAKETTFATAVAPTLYFEPINPILTPDQNWDPVTGIRNTLGNTQPIQGSIEDKGSFEVEARPDTCGFFLANALGADPSPVAGSGGAAGTYTHNLAMGTPLNTLTLSADFGGGVVHQHVGMKADQLDITAKQKSALLLKYSFIGVKDVQLASSTLAPSATYSTVPPYHIVNMTTATFNGVALPLDSVSIQVKNNIKPRWYGGSGRYPAAMDETARQVTGTFSAAYVNETLYAALASATTGALVFTFTSTAMAAGSTPYSLTITLPQISILSNPIDPKRGDITMYSGIKFVASETAAGAMNDIQISLVNATATTLV